MISLIVAYDKNRCIGKNNTIPWKLKDDMINLKRLTTNQTILMGRKTFDSIGKPLPNRINRVLTSKYKHPIANLEFYTDMNLAIKNYKTEKLFIFGGESIYKQYLPLCDELFITEVDAYIDGDTYFPEIDMTDYTLISKNKYDKNHNNEYAFTVYHYTRKLGDKK